MKDRSPGTGTFPKPEEDERRKKTDPESAPKGALGDAAVDMSKYEEEFAKRFTKAPSGVGGS